MSPVAVTYTSDFVPTSSKEFLDIQATVEWIHSEMHTGHDKNIQLDVGQITIIAKRRQYEHFCQDEVNSVRLVDIISQMNG